jgi:hypothetical protein
MGNLIDRLSHDQPLRDRGLGRGEIKEALHDARINIIAQANLDQNKDGIHGAKDVPCNALDGNKMTNEAGAVSSENGKGLAAFGGRECITQKPVGFRPDKCQAAAAC